MEIPALQEFIVASTSATRPSTLGESFVASEDDSRLPQAHVAQIVRYLEHPTREGLWRATALWNPNSGIAKFVYDGVKGQLFSTTTGKTQKARYSDDSRTEIVKHISRSVSVATIFCKRAHDKKHQLENGAIPPVPVVKALKEFFDCVDPDQFVAAFSIGFDIFEEQFIDPNFTGILFQRSLVSTKCGAFYIERAPFDEQEFIAYSCERAPLDVLIRFLNAFGMLTTVTTERIFSPEEELFEPYFELLSSVFSQAVHDQRLEHQFREAFRYYKNNDFQHCVGALGLIAEDYLAQVYEYFIRAPAPKSFTLGQTYDQFHIQIRAIVHPTMVELVDLGKIFEDIRKIAEGGEATEATESRNATVKVVRGIVNVIKSDRAYFREKLGELRRADNAFSVFPPQIKENLVELIRNRNAAAHKTRVPIGSYEAIRTLYCLISFVLWWRFERENTDWSLSCDAILAAAVKHPKQAGS